jgi:hypothetical protein
MAIIGQQPKARGPASPTDRSILRARCRYPRRCRAGFSRKVTQRLASAVIEARITSMQSNDSPLNPKAVQVLMMMQSAQRIRMN